jgi:riboflavin biosynthesis pyrimidine reductase
MNLLTPLETLYEVARGENVTLPPELAALYGRLEFPSHSSRGGRPYVITNFVSSLDGIVSLGVPGQAAGGPISGFNQHDRMVMGLLRAAADVVLVGAGTLRSVSDHVWTARYIYPALADAYQSMRSALVKTGPPLNVIVTARGELDPNLRVFQSGEVPVLIVTNTQGFRRIRRLGIPQSVEVVAVQNADRLSARSILDAVGRVRSSDVLLVEGGPHLLGDFFAESCLDEQFLTLAPQVAGRDGSTERPGFVAGRTFAPEHPLWGTLVSVKQGGSHLFLRYAFSSSDGWHNSQPKEDSP